jgi:long-chain acyl-CoA synthetase
VLISAPSVVAPFGTDGAACACLAGMNVASLCAPHPDDAVALISRGKKTTYGRLRSDVARLQAGLEAQGIGAGDRVALVAANNWYFVVSYLAVLGAGAVIVPLNPSSPGPALEKELAAVGCKAVIVGPAAKKAIDSVDRAKLPALELVVTTDGRAVDGAVTLDSLMGEAQSAPVEVDDDALAVLMFTSGTAGSPKAAMLSHGNLISNLEMIRRNPHHDHGPGDVIFGVLPFSHIFGLNVVLNLSLLVGATLLTLERFDPQSAVESIGTHKVTALPGAPGMWTAFANLPGVPPNAFETLRVASSGASRLPVEVTEAMATRFGVTVEEGYGLTEAGPVVTTSRGIPAPRGSVGVPIPGLRVRLIDADGQDVLVGDPGEIWVQAPSVFQGYWENPEATAEALTPDGWLRTGDLAVVDDKGFLYLVDRMKDLIIVSGFNVYPAEVEEVILDHPDIDDAAVVGVAHPYTGEAVKAYVVPARGSSVEEDDIIDFCHQRLAGYKCPQKVLFVDELPQGAGGKVLRRELRDG